MREVLQPVATLSALTGLCTRSFQVGEGDWPLQGLLVQVDGQLRAYINRCPHNRHPLNLSDHDFLVPGKKLLRCSSHGALFEPESGLCVSGPCVGQRLASLPCWVEDGQVWVRAPDRQT